MKKFFSLLAVTALAAGLAACSHDLSESERQTAKLGALEYAGKDYNFVSVSPQDSDGDGYVTAVLRHAKTGENLQILCGYKSAGSGCKPK